MKKIILPIIVTALSSHVLATPPANHNTVNSNQHQGIAVIHMLIPLGFHITSPGTAVVI